MAGLCLFLFFIREHQNRIHMPRGFVDDPEGDIADEEVDDGGFGNDILATDADGIKVLLLNVGHVLKCLKLRTVNSCSFQVFILKYCVKPFCNSVSPIV